MNVQHTYDPHTYKCVKCGSGIYTTGADDCRGVMPSEKTKEAEQERIWQAIRNFS